MINHSIARIGSTVSLGAALVGCDTPPVPPPPADPRIIWTAAVTSATVRPSVDDKRVFFGDFNHQVVAVGRETGKTIWTRRNDATGGAAFQSADGTTVAGPIVAIADAYLFGTDRVTGEQRWRFFPDTITGFFSYIASNSTTVFAGSGDGQLYAVDAETGKQKWAARVADDTGGVSFNPTVWRDTVYVGYLRKTVPRTGGLGAFDAATGTRLWYVEFTQHQPGFSAASHGNAVFVNNLVIAASDGGEIIALERGTGAVQWKAPRNIQENSVDDVRPLVVSGQILVAGSLSGLVTAYDVSTGRKLWTHKRGGSVIAALAADSSKVFLVDLGGSLVALDAADGRLAWTAGRNTFGGFSDPVGAIRSSPIVVDGIVYVGGERAGYAFRTRD